MLTDQLTRVRDLAVKQGRTHLAMDAQAAIDGCPHSLEAVVEWLAGHHDFEVEALCRAMPSAPAFVLRTEPFGLRPVGLQSVSQRKVA